MGEDRKELTAIQQTILYKKRDNPDWSHTDIADSVGCSPSHVSETLRRWDPKDMAEDGTVPKRGQQEFEQEELDVDGVIPGSDYFGFVVAAVAIQIGSLVLLFDSSLIPVVSSSAAFWIGFLAWLSQPVIVFADANELARVDAPRKPNRIVWPIAVFVVPVIGPLLYLRKRIVF